MLNFGISLVFAPLSKGCHAGNGGILTDGVRRESESAMENLLVTHGFMRKLTKNIRETYGKEVPHTKVLELVADALGFQSGPLMHALKNAEAIKTEPVQVPAVPARKIDRDNLPDLENLGSMTSFDVDIMRSIGERKTGLVVVIGLTGSGKTVFTHSLIRQWVKDTGRTAYTSGDMLEFPKIGGRHHQGMIIPNATRTRMPLRGAITAMQAYDPGYFLATDHVFASQGDRIPSRIEDFMTASDESRKRLVVISGHGPSHLDFLGGLAKDLAEMSSISLEEAETHILKNICAVVSVSAKWGQDRRVTHRAELMWSTKKVQSAPLEQR